MTKLIITVLNLINGFGFQLFQKKDGNIRRGSPHIINGSTVVIDKGYHPCVVAPGYEMYYFTILGGLSQRSLDTIFSTCSCLSD